MPGITIKEYDITGAGEIEYNDYTVLIPGHAADYDQEQTSYNVTYPAFGGKTYTVTNGAEFLLETREALKAIIGRGGDLNDNISYLMSAKLLDLGMKVLYVVNDAENLASDFFDKFQDRGLYDLRFITGGGFETKEAIANDAIKCASRRGDAVALINVPVRDVLSKGGQEEAINTEGKIQTWCDNLDDTAFKVGDISETPCKYGMAFAGHFYIGNKTDITYPAFFDYLACFAANINSYAAWYAMSGAARGKSVLGALTLTDFNFGDSAINFLQPRKPDGDNNLHKSCNVIANIRPYGNLLWGNRTLHPIVRDSDKGIEGLIASNFANIRQLCCTLKKTIYRACRRFTYEPNTDTLWVRFSNEIIPLLDRMKADQGIRGYKLLQVQTSEKAMLKAVLRIIPIEAVEDFDITVELADSIEIGE